MYKEILITRDEREGRAAVLEDGVLAEFLIARDKRQVGSIYKGKVMNVLPGMNAAFVDIGLERNAFLSADDAAADFEDDEESNKNRKKPRIEELVKVNEETIVQVVKDEIGNKGARITTYVTLPGRHVVLLPAASYIGVSRRLSSEQERTRLRELATKLKPDDMGIIVRTSCEGKTEEELKREIDYLKRSWDRVQKTAKRRKAPVCLHQELAMIDKIVRDILTADVDRVIIDNEDEYNKIIERLEVVAPAIVEKVHFYHHPQSLFEFYGIDQAIEEAIDQKVWLESGGYLIIDRTEALWVIDVNTGKFTGSNNLADTILKTNLEAVTEICRQLRLRDIGGIIIVDFIDMESAADRRRLLARLNEELDKDRTRTHMVGMTELGLVQLTRKREGKDLDLVVREECPYCEGRGRILSPKSLALRVRRSLLKQSIGEQYEAALVRLHPRVAMDFIGIDGRNLDNLAKQRNLQVFVQVDEDFHQEEYKITMGTVRDLKNKIKPITQGLKRRVYLDEAPGLDSRSALAVIEGHCVEVQGGADFIGQALEVRVSDTKGTLVKADLTQVKSRNNGGRARHDKRKSKSKS